MSDWLQGFAVAAAVVACIASLLRRLLPRACWQAQARLSIWLETRSRPGFLRHVGSMLRPSLRAGAGGCGSPRGCGGCRGCD